MKTDQKREIGRQREKKIKTLKTRQERVTRRGLGKTLHQAQPTHTHTPTHTHIYTYICTHTHTQTHACVHLQCTCRNKEPDLAGFKR